MARCEPTFAPTNCPNAIHKPTIHKIFPPSAKIITEARFVAKLKSFAWAREQSKLNPPSVMSANIKKRACPGTKETIIKANRP